jgi:cytochrome c oxidase subunit IV
MSTHAQSLESHGHDHSGAAKLYLRTLLALLFLTIVTVGAAYIDFGSGNVVIALAIATIKATLVALFFMHLRYEKPVNGVIAAAGFLFLGIFLMFCFIDVDSRVNLQPVNLRPPLLAPDAAPAAAPPATEKK